MSSLFQVIGPMVQPLLQQGLFLAAQVVKDKATERQLAAKRAQQLSPVGFPPVAGLPSLPALPSLSDALGGRPFPSYQAAPVVTQPQAPLFSAAPPAGTPTVAQSYAAEIETSVACTPCTRRHLSTMVIAADAAAASTDTEVWKEQLAIVTGEALVWMAYDVTPEKLERARPQDRMAIASVVPQVQQLMASTPHAPDRLVLAWAATVEAQRFYRSAAPTATDMDEIRLRMSDVEGLVGYLETTAADHLGSHLTSLREARHRLAKQGYGPEHLAYAAERLKSAVVALTAETTADQVQQLAVAMRRIRDGFYRQVVANMGQQPAAPQGNGGHVDLDVKAPVHLRPYLSKRPSQSAPGDSAAVYDRVVQFNQLRGVPVSLRNLEASAETVIEGLYLPESGDRGTILMGAAAVSKDPYETQTLLHETAHSLLHNLRCNVYPYSDHTPHEKEADLVAMAALGELGLPLEWFDGTRSEAGTWEIDWDELRAEIPEKMYTRVRWATGIIVAAGRGEIGGAVAKSNACPT